MPFPTSVDQSDTRSLCHAFARWFHAHGISWSGTPAELASDIAPGKPGIPDPNELVVFLETNADILAELGITIRVHRPAGRPRSISLRSNGAVPRFEERSVEETQFEDTSEETSEDAGPPSDYESVFRPSEVEQTPAASETRWEEHDELPYAELTRRNFEQASDSTPHAAEFFRITDTPLHSAPKDAGREFMLETSNEEGTGSVTFQTLDSSPRRWQRFLPISIALLVSLVVLGLVLRSVQQNGMSASSLESPVAASETQDPNAGGDAGNEASISDDGMQDQNGREGNKKAQEPADSRSRAAGARDNSDASELKRLMREAGQERQPAAQHELGTRYAEGHGVTPDKVKASAWLVLAWSNGHKPSQATLRALTSNLSEVELQKVRMAVADMYSSGIGVPVDLVAAHSWFSLAEVAGSAEATVRKKEVEARMTPEEIERAQTRTTAWLSSH